LPAYLQYIGDLAYRHGAFLNHAETIVNRELLFSPDPQCLIQLSTHLQHVGPETSGKRDFTFVAGREIYAFFLIRRRERLIQIARGTRNISQSPKNVRSCFRLLGLGKRAAAKRQTRGERA
jgi:hypothetical protein